MKYLFVLVAVLATAAAGLWIRNRLVPVEPPIGQGTILPQDDEVGDWPGANTHLAVRITNMRPAEALSAFHEVARQDPGTSVLTGAPEEGRIVYVSRTPFWGFRDITTVEAEARDGGSRMAVFGRSELGRSDHGVNQARIEGWLSAMGLSADP